MAETTTHDTSMTREETAEFLRSIADELDSGRDVVAIPVGNKEIHLSPPESIDTETTITERSRRLRKNVEEMALEFRWNPAKDTTESESANESEPEPESERQTESGESETGTDSELETNR